ncbi:MAG: DUF4265 domain-containing protein [Mycobacteriales bacterium]
MPPTAEPTSGGPPAGGPDGGGPDGGGPNGGPDGSVRLLAATGPSGRPVFENVPARPAGPGRWQLLASPGLALGAAAGDTVAVSGDGSFTVAARSGNVAVHVSGPTSADRHLDALTRKLEALGGWLDGRSWTRDRTQSLAVYTIPVKAGFAAMEQPLREYATAVPDGDWNYINVYDPADGTPLNWWQ